MIKVVEETEPWDLEADDKQVVMEDKAVFVAGYDYYEKGGIPYSGVRLDLADLEQLAALLRKQT